MSDIDLTLSAQNEASKVLREFSADVSKTSREVELSFKGFAQAIGANVIAEVLLKAASAVRDFGVSSMEAFDQANRSAIRLEETLSIMTGDGAGAGGLKEFANQLERMSNVDSSKIMDVMSASLRRGADGSDLQEMTKAAIGLARVYDTDLATAMRKVEDAMDGNFGAFDSLAEVSRAAEQGLKNASEAAKTTAESGARMQVAWNNLYETVGKVLSPLRDVAYAGFETTANLINDALVPAIADFEEHAKQLAETWSSVSQKVSEGFITTFTAAEVVITHAKDVFNIAINSMMLSLEQLRSTLEYVFGDVMKGYIEYFAGGAGNIASGAYGIFDNIGYNIANFAFLATNKQGMSFEDMPYRDLLDFSRLGFFEKQLPEFGGRKVTDYERSLQGNLDSEVSDLFDEFYRKLGERLKAMGPEGGMDPDVDLKARDGGKNPTSMNAILSAFQSDIMRFAPTSPTPDRLYEEAVRQREKLEEVRKELVEANRNDRRRPKLEMVNIP